MIAYYIPLEPTFIINTEAVALNPDGNLNTAMYVHDENSEFDGKIGSNEFKILIVTIDGIDNIDCTKPLTKADMSVPQSTGEYKIQKVGAQCESNTDADMYCYPA